MPSERKLILGQVAYITDQVDVHETGRWYRDVLGFLPSGATDKFGGPDLANLQGLSDPDCALNIVWMVERNDAFQLELFEYVRPQVDAASGGLDPARPRLQPDHAVRRRLRRARSSGRRAAGSLGAGPLGADGERRALVTDPNGILLELLERDIPAPGAGSPARPEVGVAVRAIRASVGDLERSLAYFVDGFGLEEVDVALHGPEHEALWGLDGAAPETRVLVAGEVFLELARYDDPAGAPFPDGYELCDGGVMNIALSTTSREFQEEVRDRVVAAGHESRDFDAGDDVSVSYVTDDQGFNVELLYMAPAAYADFGYIPVEADGTASAGD